uniref:Spermatogenesis-associated protein 2 PUB-like domain-containing protein n=1 Tax=Oryzias latipes TaxID=8090 RepID=A0A3P9LVT5_ORYLA
MKDRTGAAERAALSRQEVYEDYVRSYPQLYPEIRPCGDARLLERAAQYLRGGPDLRKPFTVFPFYQALTERRGEQGATCRKHLEAVIRCAELLETVCVHLRVQPWRKEIRNIKTFTGPFVYCLLAVFSMSTLQSILAFIGYLPHNEEEFRLNMEVSSDAALVLGFELLLARMECSHLLELLAKDHLGPEDWSDVLQRRAQSTKPLEGEKENTMEQKEEEKTVESDKNEASKFLESWPLKPQPKSQRCYLSADQSIMEMQRTYPDLAFRGRPLRQEQLCKGALCSSERSDGDAAVVHSQEDVSEPGKDLDSGDICTGGTTPPPDPNGSSCCNGNEERANEVLSGPKAISLHITLRAGQRTNTGSMLARPRFSAELPGEVQQQPVRRNDRGSNAALQTLSSLDEDERDLRELVKRMDTPTEKREEHPNKHRGLREMKSSSDESLLESAPSARRRRNLTTAGRHAGLRSQMDLKGESEEEGGQKEKECIV